MEKYGIWIRIEHWCTAHGGPDRIGTKDAMEARVQAWVAADAKHPNSSLKVTYEVRPYTGDDPSEEFEDRYIEDGDP